MGSFVDPSAILAMLLMLLTSGVRDLASCLSTDAYWNAKSVTVSVDQLKHELDEIKPADVSKFVGDLDADDPKTRDAASEKIAALGPAAIAALEDLAKNGSPEASSRATSLIAKIRAGATGASVRRLMAIRTLGERKEASALPELQALADSKEMFVGDYAKAAIAKIQGKSYSTPVATEAERMADLGLLPSRLDIAAQMAPEIDGVLPLDKWFDQLPTPADQKAKAKQETITQIVHLLDTVGNVRLNSITWGFYAAPPGVPGNSAIIAHGVFDRGLLVTAIRNGLPASHNVNGVEVFQITEDQALLVAEDGRIIYLNREGGGELGLDKMTAALAKGTGEFSANPDLPALVKGIDVKAPLWAVTKMAEGLKEKAGPLGDFNTLTLVTTQTMDHDKVTTRVKIEAVSADPAKAKGAVEMIQTELNTAVAEGRQEEKTIPFIKPMVDFAASIKLSVDGGKATLDGSLQDMPMIPWMMMGRMAVMP